MGTLDTSMQAELGRALERRQAELQAAIDGLRDQIAAPAAGPGPEVRDAVEDGDARMMSTLDLTQLGRQEQGLREVQAALQRLGSGRYGLCETCEEPIVLARLKARPEARFCLEHEAQWEKDHPQAVATGGFTATP